ncbi:MAG: 23S rRNA (adenine(2030)-N(6))-methyltransferase RlmJ [Proteobacteria bacterium]|nr:23S rRNA (adenine(2030)-N(6))-methyltransferase RlmJ [Pseudomonadota bacterium]
MNYRHAFHAGNFADCMKHALLVWLLGALARKPRPFFVLDTHAGPGFADLASAPAARTQEWQAGIGRLLAEEPPAPVARYLGPAPLTPCLDPTPLAPYLDLVRRLGLYPGSPALIRALLRPGDRLACCELHPEDHAVLHRRFATDPQVGVHRRDGYAAIKALLPPPERRGLVLIDPPFEEPGEFERLVQALRTGLARFPGGVFAAWYPIKHRAPLRDFFAALQSAGLRDLVAAELWLRAPLDPERLNGCGLVVANPPWRFEEEVPPLLDALLDGLRDHETEAGDANPGEPGAGTALIRLADG